MARKGSFTQASTSQKPKIDRKTQCFPFKALTINSSNKYGNPALTSHGNEVNIPVVAEIVGASKTDENSPNKALSLEVLIKVT